TARHRRAGSHRCARSLRRPPCAPRAGPRERRAAPARGRRPRRPRRRRSRTRPPPCPARAAAAARTDSRASGASRDGGPRRTVNRNRPPSSAWAYALPVDSDPGARDRLARLVDEQAALRRVATAVAGGAAPERVFDLVTEEAGRLLHASSAGMIRYEPGNESAIVVGRWHGTDPHGMEVGTVVPVSGDTGVAHVLRT